MPRVRSTPMRFATLLSSVAFFLGAPLHAAGRTSAAFLQLGSGARASAMGDAFTAVADDASATYWNPAGMARLRTPELLAEHALHLQGIGIERLAYVHPLRRSRPTNRDGALAAPGHSPALGVSGAFLHLDGIEGRSGNTAQPDRTFGASDASAALSYAHPLRGGRFASTLGVSAKALQQRIDDRKASSYAFDFGVTQQVGAFRLGAALANVGPGVKFIDQSYPLPQTVRLGASFQPRELPMTVAFGADVPRHDGGVSYRLGAEYGFGDMLAFRLGYTARPGASSRALKGSGLGTVADGELAKITGLVGGVGFRLLGYGVDYAFQPYGELGSAHKVSLSARFK
jgi:hypothetical protein